MLAESDLIIPIYNLDTLIAAARAELGAEATRLDIYHLVGRLRGLQLRQYRAQPPPLPQVVPKETL